MTTTLEAATIGMRCRQAKRKVKAQITAGELCPAHVARSTDLPFRVGELIRSVKGWGKVKVTIICDDLGLDPDAYLAGSTSHHQNLSVEDREVFAAEIERCLIWRTDTALYYRNLRARRAA